LKDSEKGYLGITGRDISESVSKAYGIPVGVYVAAVSDTVLHIKQVLNRAMLLQRLVTRRLRLFRKYRKR